MAHLPSDLLFSLLVISIAAALPPPGSPPALPPATQPAVKTETITIAGESFKLEIAADPAAREKGLMGRTEIAQHGGMLFIHPRPAVQSYWMANCSIDIDILFLDAHGKIVAAHAMKAEPPRRDGESQADYQRRLRSYTSRWPAQFAIELKKGSIERLQLKPGTKIQMDVDRLKNLAK